MLKQRVITALVLLAVLVPALLHPNASAFQALVLLMVAAGGWEWGRLNGLGQVASWASAAVLAVLGALAWQQGWLQGHYPLLWLAAILFTGMAVVVLKLAPYVTDYAATYLDY